MSKSKQCSNLQEELLSIINEISQFTKEVSIVINNPDFSPEIDLSIINDKYIKRNLRINMLNEILSTTEGVKLINNNEIWNEFVNDVMPIEKENIAFLQSRANETKEKLIDINKKKSLLVYDKMNKQ